jgi:predicted RNase H-like HicB family nuclease
MWHVSPVLVIHRDDNDVEESRMLKGHRVTAVIEREADGYTSLCLELDIASQGDTIEEARANLQEAVDLFFETASPSEIDERFRPEVYVTQLDISVG